uniref:TLC domain-containing protein n=1 Tax=Caenorhabditis tropicalis TaxID=1561998 RepID=A0A1I7U464_9PELO
MKNQLSTWQSLFSISFIFIIPYLVGLSHYARLALLLHLFATSVVLSHLEFMKSECTSSLFLLHLVNDVF